MIKPGSTVGWGVPEWRNSSAYPIQLTDRQWWWQFTRRRTDYRQMWVSQCSNHPVEHDTVIAADYRTLRLQFEMSRILDPTKDFSDWDLMCHRLPRNGGIGKSYEHLNIETYKAWLEKPETAPLVDISVSERKKAAEREEFAGVYGFTFNLKQPLKPQLKTAERHLQAIQDELYGRKKRKPEPGNWPTYLRILDARDAHASWRIIGETLWPRDRGDLDDRARKHHRAAEAVRDRFPLPVLTGATI